MRINSINCLYGNFEIQNRMQQQKKFANFDKISSGSLLNTNPIYVNPVNFTSTAPNSEVLRKLFKYHIPDFYSQIIILSPEIAAKIFESRVFSSSLGNISEKLSPHYDSLFKIEAKVYDLISSRAKTSPNMLLTELIRNELFQKHNRKLKNIQNPIFKQLDELATDFPADLLEEYQYLMYLTRQKIKGEAVFEPFSVKEFRYKLNRIRARIGASYQTEEGRAMNKLINIAASVPDIPREIRISPDFKIGKYEDKQKLMVERFSSVFSNSVLKDDADLQALIETANLRVLKVPTITNFSRKSFLHELQKITDRLEDLPLVRNVTRTAISLPTSKQNLSAFIVKSADRSAEQIGYDLLSGSIGSVDHFLASYNKGEDSIYNYVLSSSYMNSLKAHKRFAVFLKENPDIEIYSQRQIDVLVKLANKGVFKRIGLSNNYILNLIKNAEKQSKISGSPPLILDAHELKY